MIQIENLPITDKLKVGNEMNKYFANIVEKSRLILAHLITENMKLNTHLQWSQ